jgi:methylated-DNA-[protein]-cysteine S-methyltransferase
VNEMDMEELNRIVGKLGKSRSFHRVASATIDSTIGPVTVHACELGVISVDFGIIAEEGTPEQADTLAEAKVQTKVQAQAQAYAEEGANQLTEYFRGERSQFTVPLVYEGTEFQKAVWQALLEIPYGETRTYKEIALQISRPKAVRAVGQANRANPIAIIVPCHRVIGAGGGLVGYAGSHVDMKAVLLELEQRTSSTGCA